MILSVKIKKLISNLFERIFVSDLVSDYRMPPALTHEQSRLQCCAACGNREGAKNKVTASIEELIKNFAHPSYSCDVESFPTGLCNNCKFELYQRQRQKKAGIEVSSPHSSWTTFHLQMIKVLRGVAADKFPCPICMCSKYNPIGVTGEKSVTQSPSINVTGGQMKCEVQPPVVVRDKGLCTVCLQITGRGIRHSCSRSQVQQGRERCHSFQRDMVRK